MYNETTEPTISPESPSRTRVENTPFGRAFIELNAKLDDLKNTMDATRSTGGAGGGGGMSLLEYRLAQIEARADKTDAKLDKVTETLSALNATLSGVSSRLELLEKKIPSWWQAPLGAAGLISLVVALFGLAKSLHWFG